MWWPTLLGFSLFQLYELPFEELSRLDLSELDIALDSLQEPDTSPFTVHVMTHGHIFFCFREPELIVVVIF
jgi:hypothetical protein